MTTKGGEEMGRYIGTALVATVLIGAGAAMFQSRPFAPPAQQSSAVFTPDGKMKLPTGYRDWVFLGSPLTPNALNNGKAAFPEYHNVYIEPCAYEKYQKTHVFPEGTIMFKDLQLTLPGTFPDGSRTEPSGRGYFPGAFNGAEATVKDSKRFVDTGGWGY